MPKTETTRAKKIRRRCLVVLRAARQAGGDGWTAARACFSYLRPEFDGLILAEIDEAFSYLEGKEYAETRRAAESNNRLGELQARIGASGLDLLGEMIPADPGVEDLRV